MSRSSIVFQVDLFFRLLGYSFFIYRALKPLPSSFHQETKSNYKIAPLIKRCIGSEAALILGIEDFHKAKPDPLKSTFHSSASRSGSHNFYSLGVEKTNFPFLLFTCFSCPASPPPPPFAKSFLVGCFVLNQTSGPINVSCTLSLVLYSVIFR